MNDRQIVELYFERSEKAIEETQQKYGVYLKSIAYNILHSHEDSEECVSDTYLRAWNSIPPHSPSVLKTFLGKITRNLSLDRYDRLTAEKRGKGQAALAFEELQEALPASDNTDKIVEKIAIKDILNRFLASLSAEQRVIFMRRYWYFHSVKEISEEYGIGESKVKMSLSRSRKKLKAMLEKEEFYI